MNFFKYVAAALLIIVTTSCNFTETMTLNDDGSGKMSVFFDASELMAMGGADMFGSEQDENKEPGEVMDSIIDFKQFIAENRDSINALSPEERAKIMRLEPFKMHIIMNEDEKKMSFDMFTDFKDVAEASNILEGFENMDAFTKMGGDDNQDEVEQSPKEEDQENVSVRYEFAGNVFKRDAYVKDAEKYKTQVDSLESMAMFFGGSSYKLQYTFPRKIKSTNKPSATFSADGKTMYYQVSFMEYMKNPDVMDIEVTLED